MLKWLNENLEEFLISGDLKEPVSLSLERDSLELYEVQSSLKDTLRIRRSSWGFLRAEITVEGDFLEWDYSILDGTDACIARISKQLLNLTDTYVIDVDDPGDALCALMLTLAIDAEKCSRN